MSSALPSRAVAERALHLPVATNYGRDSKPSRYIVASGSEPGKVYVVMPPDNAIGMGFWSCDCVHGPECSHEWAARAHADPAVRRQLRALVRGPRRMGREAAERLVERYARAVSGMAQPTAAKLAADIVARLTGHADADDADA